MDFIESKMDFFIAENYSNKCGTCLKQFSSRNNKLKHERVSKCATYNKMLLEKYNNLEMKLTEIDAKMDGKNTSGIIHGNVNGNITNNSTTNTVIQNNFIMNRYGHEDTSYITDEQRIANLKTVYQSIPNMILMKHYNKNHPENSNVLISNLKGSHAYVYKDPKDSPEWRVVDKNVLVHEMYDNNYMEVTDDYKNLQHHLSDFMKTAFDNYTKEERDNDQVQKDIIKSIKLILFNNRKIAIAAQKKQ